MLKNYLIAGTIFLILLAGGYWQYNYIGNSSVALAQSISTVEKLVAEKNWSKAGEEIRKVKTQWEEMKKLWSVFLDHQKIDDIDLSIMRIEQYINAQEIALSLGELSVLLSTVNNISDNERITFKNLL